MVAPTFKRCRIQVRILTDRIKEILYDMKCEKVVKKLDRYYWKTSGKMCAVRSGITPIGESPIARIENKHLIYHVVERGQGCCKAMIFFGCYETEYL